MYGEKPLREKRPVDKRSNEHTIFVRCLEKGQNMGMGWDPCSGGGHL